MKITKTMLHLTIKPVFMTCLAIVFLKHFGYPSYLQFKQQDTVFSEKQVAFDPERPVMITIYAWRRSLFRGWKTKSNVKQLEDFCNLTDDYDQIARCIKNETFRHDEIIAKYSNGDYENQTDISKTTVWTEGLTTLFAGKSYSVKTIYKEDEDNWFYIHLKTGQNYTILIHDPDFYLFTVNPDTIPKISLTMEDGKSQGIYIKAVYHKKMDKPNHSCVSAASYSFTGCVADFVAKKVGCRLEFDSISSRDIPVCTNVNQLLRLEEEYLKTWDMRQSRLVKHTGCKPPCSYVEYKMASEPIKYKWEGQKFGIKFSTSNALERAEHLMYPLVSFISEFGGALGLFLGFSFNMICDVLEVFLQNCLKKNE